MPTSYLCIVIMIFIPIVCAAYAKFSGPGYNNRSPREFLEKLQGKPKRAHYAQLNSFEAFAPFAVGVLAAHQLQTPDKWINLLAISFICMRILYALFYIADRPLARSIVWCIGLMITVALYIPHRG